MVRYEWFRNVLYGLLVALGITSGTGQERFYHMPKTKELVFKNYVFLYNPPCTENNSYNCAYEFLNNLKKINLRELSEKYEKVFIVGPETSYPYPINKNIKYVQLWSKNLTDRSNLLLGTGWKRGQKLYQTVSWIRKSLIIKCYDKTHRVPFVEKMPRLLKNNKFIRRLFWGNPQFISKGKNKEGQEIFELGPGLSAKIILCSELFTSSYQKLGQFKDINPDILIVFVNDNWFCDYIKRELLLIARLKSILIGKPILFIGH